MPEDGKAAAPAGRCPICGKPSVQAVRPFCSARCADIDLGRWVSGAYVITSGGDDADEDGAPAPDATGGTADAGPAGDTGGGGDAGGGD